MELLEQRRRVLAGLRRDKNAIRLDLDEVRALDGYLAETWDIRCRDEDEVLDLIRERAPRRVREEFFALNDKRAFNVRHGRPQPSALERRFYNLIAHSSVNGFVHSLRRVYILDVAAWVTSIVRHLDIQGPILEFGCHSGHTSGWLARATGVQVIGTDFAENALALAGRELGHFGNLRFERANRREGFQGEYDLVLCVDSLPHDSKERERVFQRLHACLRPGGLFLLVGGVIFDPDRVGSLQLQLRSAGLGFALADVVGGWTGGFFSAEFVLTCIRGDDTEIPSTVLEEAKEGWDGYPFAPYSNDKTTPWEEKSIAYFRAKGRFAAG